MYAFCILGRNKYYKFWDVTGGLQSHRDYEIGGMPVTINNILYSVS